MFITLLFCINTAVLVVVVVVCFSRRVSIELAKNAERERKKSGTRKRTKDLMKIDGRKELFSVLFLVLS